MQALDAADHETDSFRLPPCVDSPSSEFMYGMYGSPSLSPSTESDQSLDDFPFFDLSSSTAVAPIDLLAGCSPTSLEIPSQQTIDPFAPISPVSIATSDHLPWPNSPIPEEDTGSAKKKSKAAVPRLRANGSNGVTKASKTRKRPSTSGSGEEDPNLHRARQCHNVVEKNYRNRLNRQFELLLVALTETRARSGMNEDDGDHVPVSSDANGSGDGAGVSSALSKSAVLQLARQTLLSLDRGNQLLTEEVERLNTVARQSHLGGLGRRGLML